MHAASRDDLYQRKPHAADSSGSVGASAPTLSSCGEVASVGSASHPIDCTPCAFYCFKRQGCVKDKSCTYCHMAHKSRQIKRREAWRRLQMERRQLKHTLAQDGLRGQHLVRAAARSEERTRAPAAHTLPRPTTLSAPAVHMVPLPRALVGAKHMDATGQPSAPATSCNESAALAAPAAPWRRAQTLPLTTSAAAPDDSATAHLGPTWGHEREPQRVAATFSISAGDMEIVDRALAVTVLHF